MSNETPNTKQLVATCHAITSAGQRCRARPIPNSQYCLSHAPEISAEQRKEWAAKGGRNSASKVRARSKLPGEILSSEELASWLSVVFRKLIDGKMDPPVATAAANLARTMNEIARAAEVDQRIAELESVLNIRKVS